MLTAATSYEALHSAHQSRFRLPINMTITDSNFNLITSAALLDVLYSSIYTPIYSLRLHSTHSITHSITHILKILISIAIS